MLFWMSYNGLIAAAGSPAMSDAVVEAEDEERLDQELCCFPSEEGLDPEDVVKGKSAGSGHRDVRSAA